MKGLKIITQALALMGISSISQEVRKTGLCLLNLACEDLGIPPLENVENKLPRLTEKEHSALIYGVAAKLSASMGDEYLKEVFEKVYLQKRKEIKSSVSRVKNSIFQGVTQDE